MRSAGAPAAARPGTIAFDEKRARRGTAGTAPARARTRGRRAARSARAAPGSPAVARSAPPGPSASRAATIPTPIASAISTGWYSACHCGMPRSNSSWKVDSPISVARGQRLGQQPRATAPGGRRARLGEHQPRRDRRQRGAADHQQVGRTPHGHVDAVHRVPVVVEREADQRARPHQAHRQRRPGHAQAADRAPRRGRDRRWPG